MMKKRRYQINEHRPYCIIETSTHDPGTWPIKSRRGPYLIHLEERGCLPRVNPRVNILDAGYVAYAVALRER